MLCSPLCTLQTRFGSSSRYIDRRNTSLASRDVQVLPIRDEKHVAWLGGTLQVDSSLVEHEKQSRRSSVLLT